MNEELDGLSRSIARARCRNNVTGWIAHFRLSREEVAAACGVTIWDINRWIEGTAFPSYSRCEYCEERVRELIEIKQIQESKMKRQEYSKTVWKWPEGANKPMVVLVREVDPEGVRYHSNVWRKGFNTEDKYLTLADAKEHLESLQKLVDTWTEALQEIG